MDLGIKGKKAIVTAGSRGIGESIALNLAKEGVRVALIARTESDLINVVNKMGGKEAGHIYVVSDLVVDGEPEKVYNKIKNQFGEPDILINNLGDSLGIKDPYCSLDDWKKLYRINLEVTVEFSNLVIPFMKNNKWGRIINISSTAAMENNGPVPFCTTKAALNAYSRSMGRVLASSGIAMMSVMPGVIVTEGGYWEKVMKERPEHAIKYKKERCPSGEFGIPDDVGTMVAMLCSNHAKFCQGTIFPVDGGQSRHFFQTGE